MEVSKNEEYEEEEKCVCECFEEECNCDCECVECDPEWTPGIDDYDSQDSESDYDSDDSMDYVYEECGLNRQEKKQLQDQLRYLEEQAEMMSTISEEELHPSK